MINKIWGKVKCVLCLVRNGIITPRQLVWLISGMKWLVEVQISRWTENQFWSSIYHLNHWGGKYYRTVSALSLLNLRICCLFSVLSWLFLYFGHFGDFTLGSGHLSLCSDVHWNILALAIYWVIVLLMNWWPSVHGRAGHKDPETNSQFPSHIKPNQYGSLCREQLCVSEQLGSNHRDTFTSCVDVFHN